MQNTLTLDHIPRLAATLGADAAQCHLFRVQVGVLGLALIHIWTGWAADSNQASRRAVDDARQAFRGRSFVIRDCLQVGA